MVDFKITSIKPAENKTDFIVWVETAYTNKKFTFNEKDKFLHLETNKPKFLHKIKEALEKKYENHKDTNSVVDKDWEIYIGQSYDSSTLEDMSVNAMANRVIKRREELQKLKGE